MTIYRNKKSLYIPHWQGNGRRELAVHEPQVLKPIHEGSSAIMFPRLCFLALFLGQFLCRFSLLLSHPFLIFLCGLLGLLGAIRTAIDLRVSRNRPCQTYYDKYKRRKSFHGAPKRNHKRYESGTPHFSRPFLVLTVSLRSGGMSVNSLRQPNKTYSSPVAGSKAVSVNARMLHL
jgi:hypothetical protein